MVVRPPEPLADHHRTAAFDSGAAVLDDWLKRRALANQSSGATRTFVVPDSDGGDVIAYFALASGAVGVQAAPGRFRRNMPDPIPVAILARLAIDRRHQGRGLGRALVRDAALRVLAAAESIGVRGLLVHAISEDARAFYAAVGFDPSPLEPMTLMVTLADLRAALGD